MTSGSPPSRHAQSIAGTGRRRVGNPNMRLKQGFFWRASGIGHPTIACPDQSRGPSGRAFHARGGRQGWITAFAGIARGGGCMSPSSWRRGLAIRDRSARTARRDIAGPRVKPEDDEGRDGRRRGEVALRPPHPRCHSGIHCRNPGGATRARGTVEASRLDPGNECRGDGGGYGGIRTTLQAIGFHELSVRHPRA